MAERQSERSEFAVREHAFECARCAYVNDSLTAEFCSCITREPSLVCGNCSRCFCTAPMEWRRAFFMSPAAAIYRSRSGKRQHAETQQPTPLPGQLARPVILIVDDDRMVHKIADKILEGFAGTVLHANDGEAALDLAKEVKPDLVVTDALLPKLDGRELARKLKSLPELKGCKVALMTALYKGTRYRSEAFNVFKVDEFLEKPVAPAALRALAASVVPGGLAALRFAS